jgi:hypothetical protein
MNWETRRRGERKISRMEILKKCHQKEGAR